MPINLMYTTAELEKKNETGACPHCHEVVSTKELLNLNFRITEETGRLIKCLGCGTVTFIHDDYSNSVNLTEPVRINWVTDASEALFPSDFV